jgi:Right handed beta helix region
MRPSRPSEAGVSARSMARAQAVGGALLRPALIALAGVAVSVACASGQAQLFPPAQHPPQHREAEAPARPPTTGKVLYVDPEVSESSCSTYSVTARQCIGGADSAFKTLSDAAQAAAPGDTVLIRAGTFTTQFAPSRSGARDAYITFKAYPNESVVLTRIEAPAILLRGVSYLAIEGLTVTDVVGWGRIEDSHNAVLRKNRFSNATARGTTGGLKLVRSRYIRIVDNRFETANDSIVIQESDRNVVEGNAFLWGRHSLLSVRCSNFNVIRNNRFHNERQKAAEIYDCEAVSDAPFRLDATRRNLFEGNTFAHTRGSSQSHRYNGIQYAGQQGIVRRNVFHDNLGGALHLAVYEHEALHSYGHRIYHNTFYANRCFGLVGSPDLGGSLPSVARNNLFYKNADCAGQGPDQVTIGDPKALVFTNNAVLNRASDPRFVDEHRRDLRLQPDSPQVDAGVPLTKIVGAGTGTVMRVDDVWLFYDGHGIDGEHGDVIQLAGSGTRATVVGIDYAKGTLRLDRALSWRDGQGVSLAFEGRAPDVGAFEVSAGTNVRSSE